MFGKLSNAKLADIICDKLTEKGYDITFQRILNEIDIERNLDEECMIIKDRDKFINDYVLGFECELEAEAEEEEREHEL